MAQQMTTVTMKENAESRHDPSWAKGGPKNGITLMKVINGENVKFSPKNIISHPPILMPHVVHLSDDLIL